MSEVKTEKLSPRVTSLQLGDSGDTFTVPSGATLDIASGATITNSGSQSGFGKVLQVVQGVKTDTFSTQSATLVDITGLSVDITPSSTSSKVLVFVSVWASSSYYVAHIGLFRDSTEIAVAPTAGNRPLSLLDYAFDVTMQSTHGQNNNLNSHYLDSPSSTSTLTYKLKTARRYDNQSTPTSYINRTVPDRNTVGYDPRKISMITAMEIAG